ncbi:hypothetical protein ACWEL8_09525 [Streptomyces sp. NPDC004690]
MTSVRFKSSTVDAELEKIFGTPVTTLYEAAVASDASPALTRVLELRSFLVAIEEQVARVRDRVHEAMAPDRDMDELSSGRLRFDAEMLEAALEARTSYRAAIGDLLRTMPPADRQPRGIRTAQPRAAAQSAPAPAPPGAGAARPGRA